MKEKNVGEKPEGFVPPVCETSGGDRFVFKYNRYASY